MREAGADQPAADDDDVVAAGDGGVGRGHCVMLTVPAEPTRRDDEPHRPIRQFRPGPLLLAALIFVAALTRRCRIRRISRRSRAIALFGGAHFASRKWALLVPLAACWCPTSRSARCGGTYLQYFTTATYLPSLLAIYACVALCSLLGFGLRGRVNGAAACSAIRWPKLRCCSSCSAISRPG